MTRLGHRLEFRRESNGLFFICLSQRIVWTVDGFQKTEHILSSLQICAPASRSEVLTTLRCWLTSYNDVELLEQVEGLVQHALESISDTTTSDQQKSLKQPIN